MLPADLSLSSTFAFVMILTACHQVEHFTLQDLTLSAAPSNFHAKLKLEATINAEKSPVSLNPGPIEIVHPLAIPGAGISVPGIFNLGATVSYEVGTSATFSGTATADFGLEASLPNGAKVVADIINPDQSSATGWSGSSLDPIFEVTKIEADIKLTAYSQPKLEFGITLDHVGDVEVVVGIKLPEISSTLSVDYGESPLRLPSHCVPIAFPHYTPPLLKHMPHAQPNSSKETPILISLLRSKRSLQSRRGRIQNGCQTRKPSRRLHQPIHRSGSGRPKQQAQVVDNARRLPAGSPFELYPPEYPWLSRCEWRRPHYD